MARRPGGKAASRRSRQRRAQRPAPPPSVAATPQPLEEAGLEERAEEPREEPRKPSAPVVSAPSAARAYAGSGGSSLTERERAEYHYVERDLRNIGILTALMIALLIAAWFVFNALGLVG
jgi:hypothetical protein